MTWFKVDDSFYDHPKIFDAPDCAVALWVRAGAWSARNLTDGFVPTGMPARLCGDHDTAVRELVDRGLWRRTRRGYQFHDWNTYQPSAQQVRDLRSKRADAGRRGGLAKAADQQKHPSKPSSNGLANARPVAKQNATPSRPVPSLEVVQVGEPPHGDARASPEPPRTCPEHQGNPDPPPCGRCRDARLTHDAWERHRISLTADQRSNDARQRAAANTAAIASCPLCDTSGYRDGRACPHDPDQEHRTRTGAAAARAAITKNRPTDQEITDEPARPDPRRSA